MALHTYLPQDRLRALARGETLPDRTHGSALFADISGFTPLTEALRESLGARRGAEELTRRLEIVYTTLIAEVERYGGSVIDFAGDSIMCWFEEGMTEDDAGHSADNLPPLRCCSASALAVTCGFALQRAMRAFAIMTLAGKSTTALTLKVAIATGDARRFIVGDPNIRLLDALAGATIARTALAEQLTEKGEVLCDAATLATLGDGATVRTWREDEAAHKRFAVLAAITQPVELPLVSSQEIGSVPAKELEAYVQRALIEREHAGQGSFLTEFRPCVVLFVRFLGIDYDADSAQAQLDAFVRQAQSIVTRYDGTLLQITIGDKGSYAHVNFGVLTLHEDDARRAVKAALELRDAAQGLGFLEPLQIGITQGTLRAGAYGGQTRQTFGAMGDDVNIAARLMMYAAPGEMLVSGRLHQATTNYFAFEPRPPLPVKGKAEPLSVFAVTGERQQRAIRLQEPTYALPMVGRQHELETIQQKLDLALAGQAQVIGIVAEAGLGKSRLVAEAIRLARKKGFAGYGGACQSDGINTSYLVWKPIWSAFFGLDPEMPLRKQMRYLEGEIKDRAPERVPAMPLLNTLLGLEIPDNDFTRALDSQFRKSALTALLEDCMRAAAADEPILIVIEDVHWIDALSHDLLEDLARTLSDSRVCFVLAYRPPHAELTHLRDSAPRLASLPRWTKIELHELNRAEAEQAIRAKLAQLYPARSGSIPIGLMDQLMARAQGNPFYLEELLNYLHDRSLDPRDPTAVEKIELPDSLHTLILSRIDQLTEREKTTLRVASIIGRMFRAEWLTGYYPALGDIGHVKLDLDKLRMLDLTPLETPEPELAYLFKHIVTHEVTYESLPYTTRAQLHEQLAQYLEAKIAAGTVSELSLLDTLVYHYTHSENRTKQRVYLSKARDAAWKVCAYHTAADYLTRLMELTPERDSVRPALALQVAEAHFRLGDLQAAHAAIQQAQAVATTDADRAAALALLARVKSYTGDYADAQTLLEQAVPVARASGDDLALCQTLYALGQNVLGLGKLDEARAALEESLALARTLGDLTRELFALNTLGLLQLQIDTAQAEQLFIQVHTRALAAGNRYLATSALGNLGVAVDARKDYATQREFYQQGVAFYREVGAQANLPGALSNLAYTDIKLGRLPTARAELREALLLALRLGALPSAVAVVMNFAELAYAEGRTEYALALWGLARRQSAWTSEYQHAMDATLNAWALDPAVVERGLAKGAELDWDQTIEELLI